MNQATAFTVSKHSVYFYDDTGQPMGQFSLKEIVSLGSFEALADFLIAKTICPELSQNVAEHFFFKTPDEQARFLEIS